MGSCWKTNLCVGNLQSPLQMRRQPLSSRKNSRRRADLWFQAANLHQGRRFRRSVLRLKVQQPLNSSEKVDRSCLVGAKRSDVGNLVNCLEAAELAKGCRSRVFWMAAAVALGSRDRR
ncbi:unnamed protein product [Citrullus colocynthis]|uniref:Uncharacterized protein n=1 Tax=Citrullus colocynthis TaxID=252529 RepID=A0ABP0YZ78_9ROSI